MRHVLGLSGGKDSAALAVYMRDKVPEIEYFFTDTGAELPEVYDFLDRLEAYLGKPIARLSPERDFDHLLFNLHNGFLPSPNTRWCTRELKIRPFETWVGNDPVKTYIAIRADEDRDGYKSTKPNIIPLFPFKEAGLTRADIERILDASGVGVPAYYEWRSRSGCYFCFFQRKTEWLGLAERHPELFERAKAYEKLDVQAGEYFTWSQGETLEQLVARAADIRASFAKRAATQKRMTWQEIVAAADADEEDESCLICSL
ncbi:MAG TPA: phosphoadenosine phosphosulfate reductase family protein [Burkholderiales bacterium]|nr:phosphoadenosine phosphosulfate reductase family protein [Burkholderiales bacterium]